MRTTDAIASAKDIPQSDFKALGKRVCAPINHPWHATDNASIGELAEPHIDSERGHSSSDQAGWRTDSRRRVADIPLAQQKS
jgi:hypothetical protein